MKYSVAGDLRMLLCGNATECTHLQAGVWTLTNFLSNYMRTPDNLVKDHDPAVRSTQRSLEASKLSFCTECD